MKHVVVIGGGLAGAAATFALSRAGIECSWFVASAGASALSCGALDAAPGGVATGEVAAGLLGEFHAALGLYRSPPAGTVVATRRGVVRRCGGADRAVLDLGELRACGIGLPKGFGAAWDARWLASSLQASAWARRTDLRFFDVAVQLPSEFAVPLGALDRVALWKEQAKTVRDELRRVGKERNVGAWLLPPVCFADAADVSEWASELGVPVGETLSEVGDAAGYRFERARGRIGMLPGVRVLPEWVKELRLSETSLEACTDSGVLRADGAILATGGFLGGGFLLDASNRFSPSLELSDAVGFCLGRAGRPWSASSEWGSDLASDGIEMVRKLGWLPTPVASARVKVVGDALADSAGTAGASIASGLFGAQQLIASQGA